MLCKVDSSTVSWKFIFEYLYNSNTWIATEFKDWYLCYKIPWIKKFNNNISLSWTLKINNTSWNAKQFNVYINDTKITDSAVYFYNLSDTPVDYTYTLPANTDITVKLLNNNITSGNYPLKYFSALSGLTNIDISKTVSTHKSLPRQLKDIWEKATSTLYGYHTDNTWYTGE